MGLSKSLRVLRSTENTVSTMVHNKTDSTAILFENNQLLELSQAEYLNQKRGRAYLPEIDAYAILGVLNTYVESELEGEGAVRTFSYLLLVKECQRVAVLKSTEVFVLSSVHVVPLTEDGTPELANSVKKLLSLKVFYFSWSPSPSERWDLTRSASKQKKGLISSDNSFVWNSYLMTSFNQFNISTSDWLVELLCGFVEEKIVYCGSAQMRCCLLTRLSCSRVGARLSTRGIDSEGRVAVFAETEQIISILEEGILASFIQIRGSVPLFWEQRSYQAEQHRISFTRRFHCTTPAFLKHFNYLIRRYGRILILDLLGIRESEFQLKTELSEHLKFNSDLKDSVKYVNFDFLELCKGSKRDKLDVLWNSHILSYVQGHSCYYEKVNKHNELFVVSMQTGIVRTNCFDCLDRTNALQTYIGVKVAVALTEQILSDILGDSDKANVSQWETRVEETFASLWHHNGNNLSRLFTGTTALHSSHTKSKLSDKSASVARFVKANQLEGVMQEGFDLLLGQTTFGIKSILTGNTLLGKNRIRQPITFIHSLSSRCDDVTTRSLFTVGVATYNVNGGKHKRSYLDKANSLSDWLNVPAQNPPDVFAIGFEELVEITTKNLISTSSSHMRVWEQELTAVLSARHPYHLLTAEQLVGTCLYIFIKQELVQAVVDCEVSVVKTGMSGKAGNKGSVAVYVQIRAAKYCFVCSHFAAHQDKVIERNSDYIEACRKIEFTSRYGSLSIEDMDYVFWCGDFNYRIDMGREQVHSHVQNNNLSELLKADQLRTQIYDGCIFHGFSEGDLTFLPTFKYDVFTDRYDTSGKQRIPAWTDRVLWRCNRNYSLEDKVSRYKFIELKKRTKGMFVLGAADPVVSDCWSRGRCLFYGRSELKASDHRPVVAYIQCDNIEVEESKLLECVTSLSNQMGPLDNSVRLEIDSEKSPNSHIRLDTILAFLTGIGRVSLVKVLDDYSLSVRMSDFSLTARLLSLDGCQIDGRFVKVSCRDSWGSLFREMEDSFLSAELLSPQVKQNYLGEDTLPLAGAPLLNLPLKRAAADKSPLPNRHRVTEPTQSADSVMEQLEMSDVVNLDIPMIPVVAMKPRKPMRPVSLISSPCHSDSECDIPRFRHVTKDSTSLAHSLNLEHPGVKPSRPPRPTPQSPDLTLHVRSHTISAVRPTPLSPQPINRLSPQLINRLSPGEKPHVRSHTISAVRPNTRTEVTNQNPVLHTLASIEDNLTAALKRESVIQYSDSESEESDNSTEDKQTNNNNNNTNTETVIVSSNDVYATVNKPLKRVTPAIRPRSITGVASRPPPPQPVPFKRNVPSAPSRPPHGDNQN